MKTWRPFALFAVIAAVTIFAGCGKKLEPDVAMVIDGNVMTTDEFKNMALQRFGGEQMIVTQTRSAMEKYLNEVLESELKAVDGRSKGYANRPEVLQAFEEARNMAAIGELYNRAIVDSLVPEDSIKAYYDRDGFSVNASHILIRIDQDTDSVQAHDQVVEIRKKILAEYNPLDSAAFADAAQKYSEDESSPDGNLGYFRRGEMVPTFENVAFATKPGTMSEPVYSPFGWHLIFTHDLKPVENRPAYEEDKERTKQLVMREYGQKLMDAARQYVKDLETGRKVEFNMDNTTTVFKQINPKLPAADPFSFLSEDQLKLPLVTFDKGQYTAGDLRDYARQHMANRKFDDPGMLKALVENYITEKVLLPGDAERRGLLSLPEVMDQAKFASDTRIRQIVNADLNKLPEATDDQLMAYYNEHTGDYLLDAQYTLVEVLVSDRSVADSIKAWAESGKHTMKDLAVQYTERPGEKEKEGVFGPIRKAQYGAIGRNAATAEIGAIVGPLRVQDKWSVFKVISKEEPKPDEFANVRDKVKVDWRTWARDKHQTDYMDSLKAAIDYQVNSHALDNAFPKVEWAREPEKEEENGAADQPVARKPAEKKPAPEEKDSDS